MELREERPEDADEVGDVIAEAFGDSGVAALWTDVRRDRLVRASVVAIDDERIVGHVGVSHCWLDARAALVDALVLSPLSTLPAYQCRGVGTTLVAAAIESASESGSPFLCLEGSPAFYGARGFVPASRHGMVPASVRTPGPAFQVVVFDGYEEWMTGQLIYPSVWWRHDAAGLRDPRLAEFEARSAGLA